MSFSRVQAFSGQNTSFASVVTTSSVTATAGNLMIAVAEADTVVQNGITVTDSKGNTWNRVISTSIAATFDSELWYSVIATGGSGYTVTANDNGLGVDSLIIVEEWSGAALTSAADKSAGTSGIGTALSSGATAATVQAAELVIGAGVVSGDVTMTAGATYSNLTEINTIFSTLAFESKVVAATGVQTATMTAGTAGSWICQVATFKEAVAASSGSPTVLLMGV